MRRTIGILIFTAVSIVILMNSCKEQNNRSIPKTQIEKKVTASDILGNSEYQAISYGGYRHADHSIEPTIGELKEDMKILAAMGIKVLRTYKVHLPHASNVLKAIKELRQEDPNFEMYVMLGAWIDCKNAWTDLEPDHEYESERNSAEIDEAVRLAKKYPEIVKVIAVGNEAMVKWATSYFVQPRVILKWVNHLQELKSKGELSKDLWITSSDNFASWGGGDSEYHIEDLDKLIAAVDYISMHTYPMHDTHYNPNFWGVLETEESFSEPEKIKAAMIRAQNYAENQYNSVVAYMKSLGIDKPVHIGETGWASFSNGFYGDDGSIACDQYKEALFYNLMRDWTNKSGISCFYFEAFDEPWKDAENPGGSENHFGLFSVDGEAKYVIWDLVDQGAFKGLTRGGNEIVKSFDGDFDYLMSYIKTPPSKPDVMANQQ
ncbi:glycosyl hydrolase family 17 protein [Croceivirga thetidis]|uniref:Endo-1,3-beta-glucanase btgC n=1 Tax=Croceivirga thetidis TaxID=2721623 RepID=A0ABX1GT13_9FLAO|nr:glycosyl hydrolase family 17 protein [Croceivirga thetidis]NKI33061.1 glycosyl hydrolase family 17 [Croceivirga thetidis]